MHEVHSSERLSRPRVWTRGADSGARTALPGLPQDGHWHAVRGSELDGRTAHRAPRMLCVCVALCSALCGCDVWIHVHFCAGSLRHLKGAVAGDEERAKQDDTAVRALVYRQKVQDITQVPAMLMHALRPLFSYHKTQHNTTRHNTTQHSTPHHNTTPHHTTTGLSQS